jgi:O-antigen/teichoic acid export membrane protein
MYLVFLNRYSINKTIIFQLLRRKQYFYISIVEKISRFILPIVVFHFYGTDYGLMFGLVLGYFLLNVYTSLGGGWFKHKFVFSYRRVRVYFLYAYPVIFTALASWIISLSDRFFIDHFLDTERVGIYSILSQVGGLGSILGSIFIVYVQPIIYKEYSKDKKNALFMYLKYMKIVALIFIIIFLLFLLIPKYFFTLLINPEIIADGDYYVILSILFLSSIFGAFITCSSHFFHLKNKIYVLTLFWCVAAIINLFGNLFIQKYGLFAAGLSTLSSNLVIVLLICVWIYRNIIKTQKNYAFGKF